MKKYNVEKNKNNNALFFIIMFILLILVGKFADLQACEVITNMQKTNAKGIYLVTFENDKQEIIRSKDIDFITYNNSYFVKIKSCEVAYTLIEKI
jgi:hypothetical protein